MTTRLALAIFGLASLAAAPPLQHVDRYGDRLPPDALFRLGTLRHREAGGQKACERLVADGTTRLVGHVGKVYDLDPVTGRRRGVWTLPAGCYAGGFTPDGRGALILDDHTARGVYDFRGGRWQREFEVSDAPTNRVVSTTFSPDGRLVAVHLVDGGMAGYLRVWDTTTGKLLWKRGRRGHPGDAVLAFLPGGKHLALLQLWEYRVRVHDAATGRELRAFDTGPPKELGTWRLSPDGKTIALGTYGESARFWDIETGKELPAIGGHIKRAHLVAFSPDNSRVVTGGADAFVLVHAWPAGRRIARIDLPADKSAAAISLTPDNQRLRVVSIGERAPREYDVVTGRDVTPYPDAHAGRVTGVSVGPDGQVVSASQDGTLRVWDDRGRLLRAIRTGHPAVPMTLAASPDGRLVATGGGGEGVVRLFDRDTGSALRTIHRGVQIERLYFGGLTNLVIQGTENDDGTWTTGPFLVLHDAATGALLRRLSRSGHGPAAISRDGTLVLGPDGDDACLWNLTTGQTQRTLPTDVVQWWFAPDSRTVAEAVQDRKVLIRERATGQLRWRSEDRDAVAPQHLCFSRDGRWLALARGADVELWDPLLGNRLYTFRGHEDTVRTLAFTPDGRRLVSGGDDTTLLVWDIDSVRQRIQSSPRPLDAAALTTAWQDLGHADAPTAARAMADLLARPRQATALVRQRLRPAAVDAKALAAALAKLDSDAYADRVAAERELERLGPDAEPALRAFLVGKPSPAAHRSAQRLHRRVEHGGVTDEGHLRQLRAVEVLERLGDNHAIDALRILASGAADAWLTRQATASIERLRH